MGLIDDQDQVTEFTTGLLRTGYMLCQLASDLADALPPDAYPGEAPLDVVIDMVVGTIRTAVGEVDEHELQRATELIAAAGDRVIEHLRLALELRQRMEAGGGGGASRTYG